MSKPDDIELKRQQAILLQKVFGQESSQYYKSEYEVAIALYSSESIACKIDGVEKLMNLISKKKNAGIEYSVELSKLDNWLNSSKLLMKEERCKYLSLVESIYGEKSYQLIRNISSFVKDLFDDGKERNRFKEIISLLERQDLDSMGQQDLYYMFYSYKQEKDWDGITRIISVFDPYVENEDALPSLAKLMDCDACNAYFSLKLSFIEAQFCCSLYDEVIKMYNGLSLKYGTLENFIKENESFSYLYVYVALSSLKVSSFEEAKQKISFALRYESFADKKWANKKTTFFESFMEKAVFLEKPLDLTKLEVLRNWADEFKLQECNKISETIVSVCCDKLKRKKKSEIQCLYASFLLRGLNLFEKFDKDIEDIEELYAQQKENKSKQLIDLAILLGDYFFRISHKRQEYLQKAIEYYDDAVATNNELHVYDESTIGHKTYNKATARSYIDKIKRSCEIKKVVGISYFVLATLSLVSAIVSFFVFNKAFGVGLIVVSVLSVLALLNQRIENQTLRLAINAFALVVALIVRLIVGSGARNTFSTISIGIALLAVDYFVSIKFDEYTEDIDLFLDAITLILSVVLFLICGSLSWTARQCVTGGLFLLLTILLLIKNELKKEQIGDGLIFVQFLNFILNFVFYWIFKTNYIIIFKFVSVSLEITGVYGILHKVRCSYSSNLSRNDEDFYSGVVLALINLVSLLVWLNISLSWTVWQFVIGGILLIIGTIVFIVLIRDNYEFIIVPYVLLVLNFVFFWIFKTNYIVIFQLVSVSIELIAIYRIFTFDDDWIPALVLALINLLSIFVWLSMTKNGYGIIPLFTGNSAPSAVEIVEVAESVKTNETVKSAEVVESISSAASRIKTHSTWWKWPVGVVIAIVVCFLAVAPNFAAWINPILGFVNICLLMKYGYPGSYDIFFKCITYGFVSSSIIIISSDSKILSKILAVLMGLLCVMVVFDFSYFMTAWSMI